MTDTHRYDAKWKEEYERVIAADDLEFPDDIHTDNSLKSDVSDLISTSTHPDSIKKLAHRFLPIVTDVNNSGNMDSANGVNAVDILARIVRALKYRISLVQECTVSSDSIEVLKKMYGYVPENEDTCSYVRYCNLSMVNCLVEQIADINNGSCSQGRTTRLFQVLKALY